MSDNFNFWVPATIEKAKDENGVEVMRVKGIASTADRDSEDEVLDPIGFDLNRFLKHGQINWNHQGKNDPSKIIGEPDVARITPKGELYIEGYLYNESDLAKSVWKYGETLEKNSKTRKLGWSIEGRALERSISNPKHITKALITGVAITPTPVNVNTYVDLCKGEQKDDFIEYEFEENLLEKAELNQYLYEFQCGGQTYGITKSFSVELIEKGGEGSRGGKIIGHTKSGKPIYDTIRHSGHKDFSVEDHFDAERLHIKKLGELKDRYPIIPGTDRTAKMSQEDLDKWDYHHSMSDKHYKKAKKLQGGDESELKSGRQFSKAEQSEARQEKIKKVMAEFKAGTLKTSTGEKVTDRDQAIAIALSEAKSIEKTMDVEAGRALMPESLDGKKVFLTPEIKKAIFHGLITLEDIVDISKGGRKALLGEKRMFGGREYIKTAEGWKFHGKGTGAKAQEHAAAHPAHVVRSMTEDGKINVGDSVRVKTLSGSVVGKIDHFLAHNPNRAFVSFPGGGGANYDIGEMTKESKKVETEKETAEQITARIKARYAASPLPIQKQKVKEALIEAGYLSASSTEIKKEKFLVTFHTKDRSGINYPQTEMIRIPSDVADKEEWLKNWWKNNGKKRGGYFSEKILDLDRVHFSVED